MKLTKGSLPSTLTRLSSDICCVSTSAETKERKVVGKEARKEGISCRASCVGCLIWQAGKFSERDREREREIINPRFEHARSVHFFLGVK